MVEGNKYINEYDLDTSAIRRKIAEISKEVAASIAKTKSALASSNVGNATSPSKVTPLPGIGGPPPKGSNAGFDASSAGAVELNRNIQEINKDLKARTKTNRALAGEDAEQLIIAKEFRKAKVDHIASQKALNTALYAEQVEHVEYKKEIIANRAAQKRHRAVLLDVQAADAEYAAATRQVATSSARARTSKNTDFTGDKLLLDANGELIVAKKKLSAATNRAAAATAGSAEAFVEDAASKKRLINKQNEAAAISEVYLGEVREGLVTKSKLNAAEARQAVSVEAVIAATQERVAVLHAQTVKDQALARSPEFANEFAASKIADGERAAVEAKALEQQSATLAKQRVAIESSRITQETAYLQLSRTELAQQQAKNAFEKKALAEQVKLETAQSGSYRQLAVIRAQRLAAEKVAVKGLNRQIADQLRLDGASRFTQLQARTGRFSQGIPTGSGGSAFNSFATTARYGASSALLFGGVQGIKSVVDEAEELERVFAQIDSQLRAVGQGLQFDRVKDSIKDIARETGTAADEIAEFSFQLQGAFGNGVEINGLSGLDLVEDQLENIAKINRLTDIDDQVVVDSVTAISLALGVTAEEIGDAAFSIQNQLGVVADETINFLGDIAPVAQAAGFSLNEIATFAGIAQQRSGRAGTALAESFGRIIPAVAGAKAELAELAATNQALNTPEFIDALREGRISDQILEIGRAYEDLSNSGKQQIEALLGGRRETQVLLTVTQDKTALDTTLDKLGDSAGELDKRFQLLQETLSQKLARFGEELKQFGIEFFEAGIDDLLLGALDALEAIVKAAGLLIGAWNSVNDAFGQTPKYLIIISALLAGINKFAIGTGTAAAGANTVANLATSSSSAVVTSRAATAAAATQGSKAGGPAAQGLIAGLFTSLFAKLPVALKGALTTGAGLIGPAIAVAIAASIGTAIGRSGRLIGFDNPFFKGSDELQIQVDNVIEQYEQQSREDLEAITNERQGAIDRIKSSVQEFFLGVNVNEQDAAQTALNNQRLSNLLPDLEDSITGETGDQRNAELQAAFDALEEDNQLLNEGISNAFDEASAAELNRYFGADVLFRKYADNFKIDYDAGIAISPGDFVGFGIDTELLRDQLTEQNIQQLIDSAKAGNEGTIALLELLNDGLNSIDVQSVLDEAFPEDAAANQRQSAESSSANAKAAFEAGRASAREVADALDAEIQFLQDTLDPTSQDELANLANKLAERAEAYANLGAKSADETRRFIEQTIGSDDIESATNELQGYIDRLKDPEFTDPEARKEYAQSALELGRSLYEKAIEDADTAEEALRIAEAGRDVSPFLRAQLVTQQIRDSLEGFKAYSALFTDSQLVLTQGAEEIVYATTDEFINAAVLAIITGGESLANMTKAVEDEIARLRELLASPFFADTVAFQGILEEIASLETTLGALRERNIGLLSGSPLLDPAKIRDTGNIEEQQENVKKEAEEAAKKAEDAAKEALKLQEDAADAAEKAAEDAAKAAEERAAAARKLAEAQLDYALALVEGDPVKAARVEQQKADLAFANAEDAAGQIQAQIQRLKADRQFEDAIRDIADAQVDLLLAQAEYAGDTAEQSRLSLQQAFTQLQRVQADFSNGRAGQADVIRAQADLVRTQAQARDDQLAEALNEYEFLHEFGKISDQQLIAYLQQLKQIPGLIPEQLRDLDRKIRALNDDLGADLQFNLPSNLNLPTLYEARRTNQAGPNGPGNFVSNVINISVVDGVTLDQAQNLINSATGANNTLGVSPRRY